MKNIITVSIVDDEADMREHIAGYKVPKQVHFATSLPLTASNKVLKRALRDSLLNLP